MTARSLIANLKASVDRRPEAEVLIHGERRLRYGQLWREIAALARYLRGNGVSRGDRIAILLGNSCEYVVAYYAVLAVDGIAVALNTAARVRDLSNWLGHCGATWLIADAKHAELHSLLRTLSDDIRVITVGGAFTWDDECAIWDDIVRAGDESMAPQDISPGAHAAIIYTSGTTGRPKGVVLSHENLASNVHSIVAYLGLNEADRCLNVLPFYYSYGNSVLHTHLAVGGSLILENSLAYVHNVITKIAVHRATSFAGVPSTYALILNRINLREYDCSSLRYVTQAGGAMRPVQIQQFRQALPHVKFYVMYGQTEATARLTYLPPEQLDNKLGSVGVPIPNVRLEVRDGHGNAMPAGTTGEIHVAGPNVMCGYWNDPVATNEVLDDGWLKTGDLGYMDEEGYVYIQGRSSDMIKTGAHRISPLDIEEVIGDFDGVAEVAVVGVPDDILGQAIKAVIVPRSGAALHAMAIKAYCHARLANYKVPRHVEFATQLPKTASGKIQRYLLVNESSKGVRSNES